jgi:hypothetical protein
MKFRILVLLLTIFIIGNSFSQNKSDSARLDSAKIKKKIVKPKKWNFVILPNLGYDSDLGFYFGGLTNVFYCKGVFPDFKHSWYVEWTHYTKGSDKKIFQFESKTLIPKVRFAFDILYNTEQALDFIGFNGYESTYNRSLMLEGNTDYISRMFYKHERKMLRVMVNFKGKVFNPHLKWVLGLMYEGIKTQTVDVARINEDKDSSEMLPAVDLLYDKYIKWGIINQNEKLGGKSLLLKMGMDYDTRDLEAAPSRGMWSALVIIQGHSFMPLKDMNYTQLVLTHRQYFSLVKKHLVLAYRFNYQGRLFGEIPYYMLPFLYNSFGSPTDGLGGGSSLRGIVRNRLVGDGSVYGNVEIRWKILQVRIFKQMVGLAMTPFFDAGMVVDKHDYHLVNENAVTESAPYIRTGRETVHMAYGSGIHYIINENIIGSAYLAVPVTKKDGFFGFYMSLNYMF